MKDKLFEKQLEEIRETQYKRRGSENKKAVELSKY